MTRHSTPMAEERVALAQQRLARVRNELYGAIQALAGVRGCDYEYAKLQWLDETAKTVQVSLADTLHSGGLSLESELEVKP